MKVYQIPKKYRFPDGKQAKKTKELHFPLPKSNVNSIKGLCIFSQCKNGWAVLSIADTDSAIVATLGLV